MRRIGKRKEFQRNLLNWYQILRTPLNILTFKRRLTIFSLYSKCFCSLACCICTTVPSLQSLAIDKSQRNATKQTNSRCAQRAQTLRENSNSYLLWFIWRLEVFHFYYHYYDYDAFFPGTKGARRRSSCCNQSGQAQAQARLALFSVLVLVLVQMLMLLQMLSCSFVLRKINVL